MKKLLLAAAIAITAYAAYVQHDFPLSQAPAAESASDDSILANAFQNHLSKVHVQSEGVVTKVLPDDNDGSRHQRFLVRLRSGHTILIAHNIDLADRVPALRKGDAIAFDGEYEWNSKGGVVHWTHRDPGGRHRAGWLKHNGQTYQ